MHAHLDLSIWICSGQKSMMGRGRGQHKQRHTPGQGLGGGMASSGCVVRSCGLPGSRRCAHPSPAARRGHDSLPSASARNAGRKRRGHRCYTRRS